MARIEVGLLDLIRVPASDVRAAVAFYRDALGATVQSVSPPEQATVRLANVDVEIHRRDPAGTAARSAPSGGWEPGFRVRDVAAFRSRIEAAGASITRDLHDVPGGVKLAFADPDGNPLAVYEYGVTVEDVRGRS